MNYAKIDKLEYVNGEGIGASLFVSGCNFHCEGCFNKDSWSFEYGNKWDENAKKEFFRVISNEHIKRVSILGGEPMCDDNVSEVLTLITEIKKLNRNLRVWLYTGYKADLTLDKCSHLVLSPKSTVNSEKDTERTLAVNSVDVVVDGQYVESLRDLSLRFRGSSNQRLIDVKESLKNKKIIMYGEN